MAQNDRKRKHAKYEGENDQSSSMSLASTLASLKHPEPWASDPSDISKPERDNGVRGSDENGWTRVSKHKRQRSNKRRKKQHDGNEIERVGNQTQTEKDDTPKANYPAVTYAALHTIQASIKLSDLQCLLLYCLADGQAPQWLSVRHHSQIRKAVVLLVPGLETGMFDGRIALSDPRPDAASAEKASKADSIPNGTASEQNESQVSSQQASNEVLRPPTTGNSPDAFLPLRLSVDKLPASLHPLAEIFEHLWPVKAPGDDKYSKVFSPSHSMLTSPLPKSRDEREAQKNIKGAKPFAGSRSWENKPTPVTTFISSKEDLLENEYVLHPAVLTTKAENEDYVARRQGANQAAEDGWVDTKIDRLEDAEISDHPKGSLTAGRRVLAIDCEMCLVEGGEFALTRISIVDWDGTVVMDELVKPFKAIVDYLTPYSGITPAALNPITTTLSTIQARLLALLTPSTILLGHSLNSDLQALKLTHPFIIDTSLLYPHPRGPPLKSSLKWLSQRYLSREIQRGHGATGHDSIEDARACLDLVRLKCEKGAKWGSADAERESIFKRLSRSSARGGDEGQGKKGAIVDHGAPEKHFAQTAAGYTIGCSSDAEVVAGVRRAVLGDADGALVPGGGVEFTWARFRELETLRGWNSGSAPESDTSTDLEPGALSAAVAATAANIKSIFDLLPPCTLLIVYSGTGDQRPLSRLKEVQRTFKEEYKVKKWDELSVKWTDHEEQELKRLCGQARKGVGFVAVK